MGWVVGVTVYDTHRAPEDWRGSEGLDLEEGKVVNVYVADLKSIMCFVFTDSNIFFGSPCLA